MLFAPPGVLRARGRSRATRPTMWARWRGPCGRRRARRPRGGGRRRRGRACRARPRSCRAPRGRRPGRSSTPASASRAAASSSSRARAGERWRAREAAEALLDRERRQAGPSSSLASAQTTSSPVTSATGVPQVPHSAALMPTSPTSVPLKRRLCHLVELTVCESTPLRAPGTRVLADEQRDVAALLEHRGVLGPARLDDELAARVERVGDQRVERPVAARAVAVHDHDLARAARERAADGRVDLLGVEPPALLVAGGAGAHLLPARDPGDALHVADDQDLQAAHQQRVASAPSPRPPSRQRMPTSAIVSAGSPASASPLSSALGRRSSRSARASGRASLAAKSADDASAVPSTLTSSSIGSSAGISAGEDSESAALSEMYHSPGAGNLSTLKSVARICSKPSARGVTASPVFAPAASSPSSSAEALAPVVLVAERLAQRAPESRS